MIGWIILALLVCFLAVLVIRTLRFLPPAEEKREKEEISFDAEAPVNALRELVRCRTVSREDPALEDDAEFEKLIGLLPTLYPHVWECCPLTRFDGRGLLFRWKGTDGSGEPAVLMAHYDVVPVDEEGWKKPPFDAVLEDGVIWGRGTLDTKNTFNGILSAAEHLLKCGFTPKNDVYFAFSGGEEVDGPGAVHIVEYFSERGITPAFVLDEGGAVVEGFFPGVKEPFGMIGIAEKGKMNIRLRFTGDGGHASSPAPHTPIGRLSAACVRLENKPFPRHYAGPVQAFFDTVGRHASFALRLILANLWCFGGVLDLVCKKTGGALNALVRTTVAFTMMEGSKASNVISPSASMVANLRLNPEDTVASALDYVRKVVNDPEIEISSWEESEPSPVSRTDCEGWKIVSEAVADTWNCRVSPYLMVQCSDSRHYAPISDRVYRFSAADMTDEERESIHGNNERIRVETVKRATEFFIRVMKRC